MRAEYADSERELGDYFTSAVGISANNIDKELTGAAFQSSDLHSGMLEIKFRNALALHFAVEATVAKLSPEHYSTVKSVFSPRGTSILHEKLRLTEARKASTAALKIEGAGTVVTPASTVSLLGLGVHTRSAIEGYRKYIAAQAGHWETLYEAWTEAVEEWQGVAAVSGEKAAGPRPKSPATTCDVPTRDGLLRFLSWEAGRGSKRLFDRIRVEATHTLSLAIAAYDVLRVARIRAEKAAKGDERRERLADLDADIGRARASRHERISGIYARVA